MDESWMSVEIGTKIIYASDRQALPSLGKSIVITSISFNLICLSRSYLSPSSECILFQNVEQIVCNSAKKQKVNGRES